MHRRKVVSRASLRPQAISSLTLCSLGGKLVSLGRKSLLPNGAPRSWPRAQVGQGEGLSRAGRRGWFVLIPDWLVLIQQSRL